MAATGSLLILISPSIRDHYHNDHARELFEKREGQVISMPKIADRWPLQDYLYIQWRHDFEYSFF